MAGSSALWLFLISAALSLGSLAVGLFSARRQHAWWKAAIDNYERAVTLRVSDALSTAEKGEALSECVRTLYRRMGYDVPPHRRGRDRGIDVIVQRFGRYGIQCKNVQSPASIDAIYEAYAGSRYWNCCQRCAVAVSPAGFTDEARDFAARVGVRLIDDHEFRRLMQRMRPLGPFWPSGVARVVQIGLLAGAVAVGVLGGTFASRSLATPQWMDTAACVAIAAVIGAIAACASRGRSDGAAISTKRAGSVQPQPASS